MLKERKITLTYPIKTGDTKLKEFTMQKPKGGDYRGLSMRRLDELDFNEVFELVTRISPLTMQELEEMEPCDIRKVTETITLFFSEDMPEVQQFLKTMEA